MHEVTDRVLVAHVVNQEGELVGGIEPILGLLSLPLLRSQLYSAVLLLWLKPTS